MSALLFGRPNGFGSRHQRLMLAGALLCICIVDYAAGLV